jgi:hypothetical protein
VSEPAKRPEATTPSQPDTEVAEPHSETVPRQTGSA